VAALHDGALPAEHSNQWLIVQGRFEGNAFALSAARTVAEAGRRNPAAAAALASREMF
jgi:hypothetical protein